MGTNSNIKIINIGTSNDTINTINIGGIKSNINLYGNVAYIRSENLIVTDKDIQLNANAVGTNTSFGAGLKIRDNNDDSAGYILVNQTGTGFSIKPPLDSNILSLPISSYNKSGFMRSTYANPVNTMIPDQILIADVLNLQTNLNNKLDLSGGTMTGSINLNSTNKIINSAAPTNPGDLTNKSYVDNGLGVVSTNAAQNLDRAVVNWQNNPRIITVNNNPPPTLPSIGSVILGGLRDAFGWLTSDSQLKTNIVSISGEAIINRYKLLNPVSFDWIDPNITYSNKGFLANDIKNLYPIDWVPNIAVIEGEPTGNIYCNGYRNDSIITDTVAMTQYLINTTLNYKNNFSSNLITLSGNLVLNPAGSPNGYANIISTSGTINVNSNLNVSSNVILGNSNYIFNTNNQLKNKKSYYNMQRFSGYSGIWTPNLFSQNLGTTEMCSNWLGNAAASTSINSINGQFVSGTEYSWMSNGSLPANSGTILTGYSPLITGWYQVGVKITATANTFSIPWSGTFNNRTFSTNGSNNYQYFATYIQGALDFQITLETYSSVLNSVNLLFQIKQLAPDNQIISVPNLY